MAQDRKIPGKSFLNFDEYRDKVLGCWTGKNIGGTLGGPMEGKQCTWDIDFYTQDLSGTPAPNDDLDLQLAWLNAVERYGVYNVNEKILGQYWLMQVSGPWNEYGVGKMNMTNGILPPLSGLCNNDVWKNSNGAWIRSEIWACLFPGDPDEAAQLAWCDSCVDHADDGIYAEVFTASLEAAAFVESDVRKLLEYALIRIPKDCRVARSVHIAMDSYDNGKTWKEAREAIVADSADLGWFQAPANVAFAVVGLLYGEGDFGKSVCIAVGCGDDTDCTGATCGSVLGIIKGRKGIPQKWIDPIGNTIQTVAINTIGTFRPKTLEELTNRVIACKRFAEQTNPALVRLTDGPTSIDPELKERLTDGEYVAKRVLARSSRTVDFELPWCRFEIEFEKSPLMMPGDVQTIKCHLDKCHFFNSVLKVEWLFNTEDGWGIQEGNIQCFNSYHGGTTELVLHLEAGKFSDAFLHIPLRFTLNTMNYPVAAYLTFQKADVLQMNTRGSTDPRLWDPFDRSRARLNSL
ncbi:MAG: ADP-ribosylglycohydrolase family protein [Victivallales bacterium]|nr:ADP-ribosylglycohydrolase family protein [Victivallales bacterium]